MQFESRKILVGFRIKLNFDVSLKKENSYVFINLSKTPTIKDLLDTIKKRFEISRDIYVSLNECRLLNSEDNSVLIDVDEVKIAPCENETTIAPSKTSFEREVIQSDSSSRLGYLPQTVESNETSDRHEVSPTHVEESPCEKKQNGSVFCMSETGNRKSRRFYSSIAETLKYLNQNYKPELGNTSTFNLANGVLTSGSEDCKKEERTDIVKQRNTVQKMEELCDSNDASFEKIDDELVQKRKRKRKRKHSKKSTRDSDHGEVIDNTLDQKADSSMEANADNLPTKTTRKHIFFDVENDRSAGDDAHQTECNLSIDSSFLIRPFNKRVRKLEDTFEKLENDVGETNGIKDVTDSGNSTLIENKNFEKNSMYHNHATAFSAIQLDRTCGSDTNLANEREILDSLPLTNTIHGTTRKKSTDLQSKLSLNNGFFSTFNTITNDRSKIQTKEFPPENPHPLSTLLMCKQLQTPIEYSVQFTQSNGISRSRSNSCVSVETKKLTNNSSISNPTSAASIDDDKNWNNNDECEVLCQYKIVRDRVLLRDSSGTWNILSEKEASSKLQPIEEPQENQSITFQLLYLGADMCPSMSDLICGKVVTFQKDSGRLILNILPAFIDTLLKSIGEDACLPDELAPITENTYQISWIAVKNPRLLM